MHGFARVRHMDGEAAIAEVHEMVQVDRDVLRLADCQYPSRAVVAAVRGVVYALWHEMHKEERFGSA